MTSPRNLGYIGPMTISLRLRSRVTCSLALAALGASASSWASDPAAKAALFDELMLNSNRCVQVELQSTLGMNRLEQVEQSLDNGTGALYRFEGWNLRENSAMGRPDLRVGRVELICRDRSEGVGSVRRCAGTFTSNTGVARPIPACN